jgi:hypothetical protein
LFPGKRDKKGVKIPALRKLKQEDHKFESSVGYIAIICLKLKTKTDISEH